MTIRGSRVPTYLARWNLVTLFGVKARRAETLAAIAGTILAAAALDRSQAIRSDLSGVLAAVLPDASIGRGADARGLCQKM
jgi:hypothetical protein